MGSRRTHPGAGPGVRRPPRDPAAPRRLPPRRCAGAGAGGIGTLLSSSWLRAVAVPRRGALRRARAGGGKNTVGAVGCSAAGAAACVEVRRAPPCCPRVDAGGRERGRRRRIIFGAAAGGVSRSCRRRRRGYLVRTGTAPRPVNTRGVAAGLRRVAAGLTSLGYFLARASRARGCASATAAPPPRGVETHHGRRARIVPAFRIRRRPAKPPLHRLIRGPYPPLPSSLGGSGSYRHGVVE